MPVKKKRILIVDDHPMVRTGLACLINEEPDLEVCGEAMDVAGAFKLVETELPDLVIIDLSLAGGNGLDLINRIKSRYPDINMLVASMYEESLYAERTLTAGALGYINKQDAESFGVPGGEINIRYNKKQEVAVVSGLKVNNNI